MNLHISHRTHVRSDAVAPLVITGGEVLTGGALAQTTVQIADGHIIEVGSHAAPGRVLDAGGLFVLPGIIDIHGDGFERLTWPRPSVGVAADIALLEADRQFAANGITTAHHSVTWSWEGGQRGAEPALEILESIERLKPHLAVDTRYHLRHETFNLAAEAVILEWMAAGRIHCLAFNDHMAGTIKQRSRPDKMRIMLERSRLSEADFNRLIEDTFARAKEVPPSVERLAKAAVTAGVTLLSHDDPTPELRAWYRDLGCSVAEFPINEETAEAASAAGDPIVFGAPNVMRGGSHTGCPPAAEMAGRGLCTVLASDYYYPALPLAPFRLVADGVLPLAQAWALVAEGPAHALGLTDRGMIAPGKRADIVLVEDRGALPPRIVATLVKGRVVYLADAERLSG